MNLVSRLKQFCIIKVTNYGEKKLNGVYPDLGCSVETLLNLLQDPVVQYKSNKMVRCYLELPHFLQARLKTLDKYSIEYLRYELNQKKLGTGELFVEVVKYLKLKTLQNAQLHPHKKGIGQSATIKTQIGDILRVVKKLALKEPFPSPVASLPSLPCEFKVLFGIKRMTSKMTPSCVKAKVQSCLTKKLNQEYPELGNAIQILISFAKDKLNSPKR
jgi:hypothetical protein